MSLDLECDGKYDAWVGDSCGRSYNDDQNVYGGKLEYF